MFGKKRNGNNGNGVGEAEDELFPANIQVTDPAEEERDVAKAEGKQAAAADGGKKKRRTGALVALVFILGFGVLSFLYLTGGLSNRRVAQATVNAPAAMQRDVTSRQVTDQQISQFEQSLRAGQVTPPPGTPVTGASQPGTLVSPQMGTQAGVDPASLPVTSMPAPGASPVVPTAGAAGTVQPGQQQATEKGGEVRTSTPAQSATGTAAVEPQEAAQSSRYFFQDDAPAQPRARSGGGEAQPRGDDVSAAPAPAVSTNSRPATVAPVVPPFGTFLRLRTLGTIYTLRRDGIVRMELTRSARGEGWFLPRGTQFVGKQAGADGDRAFVNVFGYLDPASRRLVRIGGEVNSGNGIKGERKTVGRRWLRAIQQLGNPALQLFSSYLAGRSGGTQVIVPNGSVIPGVNSSSRTAEYVKVRAGVEVSLMLSDLPAPINGVTPDAGAVEGVGGGLSDDEMMELISSDDAGQIMAAMPRMNAEQRQLAEAALSENGGQR